MGHGLANMRSYEDLMEEAAEAFASVEGLEEGLLAAAQVQ